MPFEILILDSEAPLFTSTRTRIFLKTELFDPGYIETVTRIRTDPQLFENARPAIRSFSKTLPKVDLSKTEVSYPDLFCHCFQEDQKWLAQDTSRACAVSLPKPVAAHFFLFRRELPSKTKRRMDSCHRTCGYLQRQLYLIVFSDEGLLLLFHFASALFCCYFFKDSPTSI